MNSQAQDSNMDQDSEPASPTWATEEEGEESDCESVNTDPVNIRNVFKWFKCLQNIFKT